MRVTEQFHPEELNPAPLPEDIEKKRDRQRFLLEVIDGKFSEILASLKINTVGDEADDYRKQFNTAERLVNELIAILNNPSLHFRIKDGCHLVDRLGNYIMKFKVVIKAMEGQHNAGKEEIYRRRSAEILRDFRKYLNNCISDEDFLEAELATIEGVTTH